MNLSLSEDTKIDIQLNRLIAGPIAMLRKTDLINKLGKDGLWAARINLLPVVFFSIALALGAASVRFPTDGVFGFDLVIPLNMAFASLALLTHFVIFRDFNFRRLKNTIFLFLLLYSFYSSTITSWNSGQFFWFESSETLKSLWPPFGATLFVGTTLMLVDTRQKAVAFCCSLGVAILLISQVFFAERILFDNLTPFHSFYASRVFFVGFIIFLGLSFKVKDTRNAVALILTSIFLFYFGTVDGMRAAFLFYFLAIFWAVIALFSKGSSVNAIRLILVLVLSYGVSLSANYTQILGKSDGFKKIGATSEVSASDNSGVVISESEIACVKRLQSYFGHGKRSFLDDYSCSTNIVIPDDDARLRLIIQALRTNDSPIWGMGRGNYEFVEASRDESEAVLYKHPHNIVLEIFHSTGLIGLMIYFAMLVVVIVLILKTLRFHSDVLVVMSCIPVFYLCASMVGGDFIDSTPLWISALILAIFMETSGPATEGSDF